jgi:hypothetical protein
MPNKETTPGAYGSHRLAGQIPETDSDTDFGTLDEMPLNPVRPAAQAAARSMEVDRTSLEYAAQDGVTHININRLSTSELGAALAHFTYAPFRHPYFGPFNSMEGFWYFIKALRPSDELRVLSGHRAKEFGKALPAGRRANFKQIIVEANYYKVVQNDNIKALMMESELPFDHYYLYGEGPILIRPTGFEWLVEGFEEIRRMIDEDRRPAPLDYTNN